MKNELTVEKNKSVVIKALYQWPTYRGLLEGLPTDRRNTDILKDIKDDAKKHCGQKAIYVIEPIQTPIDYKGEYPFGVPMSLPSIICIAELQYFRPARNPEKDISMLTVVWFQKDYAFPIDNDIIKKLNEIEWSNLAEDFEY